MHGIFMGYLKSIGDNQCRWTEKSQKKKNCGHGRNCLFEHYTYMTGIGYYDYTGGAMMNVSWLHKKDSDNCVLVDRRDREYSIQLTQMGWG